jgi:hypothetical protein
MHEVALISAGFFTETPDCLVLGLVFENTREGSEAVCNL